MGEVNNAISKENTGLRAKVSDALRPAVRMGAAGLLGATLVAACSGDSQGFDDSVTQGFDQPHQIDDGVDVATGADGPIPLTGCRTTEPWQATEQTEAMWLAANIDGDPQKQLTSWQDVRVTVVDCEPTDPGVSPSAFDGQSGRLEIDGVDTQVVIVDHGATEPGFYDHLTVAAFGSSD